MPLPSLPPELLSDTFDYLSPSTVDLYHLLLACSSFYAIAKPVLYRSIRITTRLRYEQLLKVKEGDKRLVKHVVIRGDGRGSFGRVLSEAGGLVGSTQFFFAAGCVEALLTGKLLDISVIDTLHVRSVFESAEVYPEDARFTCEIATKLSEVSIYQHGRGGDLWAAYLTKETTPQLRRLAFAGVSRYLPPDARHPGVDVPDALTRDVPYSQLEVLVADPPDVPDNIPNFPYDHYLAPFDRFLPSQESKNWRFTGTSRWTTATLKAQLERLVNHLSTVPKPSVQLFLSGRPFAMDPTEYRDLSTTYKAKGIEFREYGSEKENEDSIIPPFFVDYLRETGKLRRV